MLETSLTILNGAPLIQSPVGVLMLVATGGLGFVLLLFSASRKPRAPWLILITFLLSFFVNVWIASPGQFNDLVQTDSAVYTDMASALLLKGQNPYTWDYSGTMALYHVGDNDSTPTLKGVDEAIFPYPALTFLLAAMFQLLHLPGMFSVLVVTYAAILILLFYAAPRRVRPIILIPTSVGFAISFATFSLIGVMDTVWAGLLLLMMMLWRRPVWRAILFGLAISFKQVPWLLAPFLLVRVWHDQRRLRDMAFFVVLSAGTFLLINGPFIASAPIAWLQGVTEPIRDSLVLLSQGGLSSLTQNGLVYLPKSFYLIAVIALLALLLFCYWRHYAVLRDVIWLFPGIALWASYRSIVTYWAYWLVPMLGVATPLTPTLSPTQAEEKGAKQNTIDGAFDLEVRKRSLHSDKLEVNENVEAQRQNISASSMIDRSPLSLRLRGGKGPGVRGVVALRWRLTAVVTLATLVGLLVLAIVSASPASIDIQINTPVLVGGSGNVTSVSAHITNNSQRLLTPRFMVQGNRTSGNPVPWHIDAGPLTLKPGQAADYRISAGANGSAWTVYDLAQLVVMDAGENSALRGVATLPIDPTLLWPDAIPNAAYQFWSDDNSSPLGWATLSYPPENGSARMVTKAGRDALALTIDPKDAGIAVVSVSVQISFPDEPFGVWIYADSALNDPPFAAYGIELDDDPRLTRYQIGELNDSDDTNQYIERLTLAPDQWHYVQIDPQALYAREGWPLPSLQRTSFRGVETQVRLLGLRLFAATSTKQGPITVYFGPIEQHDDGPSPETLMAETLNDPASYYARLGDAYLLQHDYSRAITAYQQALGYKYDGAIAAKLAQAKQGE